MTSEQRDRQGPKSAVYHPADELSLEKELLAFEGIAQGQGPLKIGLIAPEKHRYEIAFSSAVAFMCRDEGDAFLTVQEIHRGREGVHHLFRVENSRLMAFFHLESGWTNDKLSHWVVLSNDTVVDVIAFGPPEVTSLPPAAHGEETLSKRRTPHP